MDPHNEQTTRDQLFKSALTSGNTVQLQELLDKEPQLQRVTSRMLWHAVLNDQPEIASMLLEAGADPNASQENSPANLQSTILHELVKKKYDQLALLAMERGANVCATDADNWTALDHAIRKKSSLDVVRELMKLGAHEYSRANVILVVEAADHPDAAELVALLVGEFVDAETMEEQIDEALCYCLDDAFHESQVLPVFKPLLDMKKKIGSVSRNLYIVLMAMYRRKILVAQLLTEHGLHTTGLIHGRPQNMTSYSRSTGEKLAIKYLTLVIVKGKPIDDRDMEIITGDPGMHAYHTQCLDELNKMKKMKIVNGVSFLSILVNAWEMSFLTKNPKVVENYMAVKHKNEFPIYWEEMDLALQSATMIKRSLEESEEAICESLENILPYIPLKKIVHYFYLNLIK